MINSSLDVYGAINKPIFEQGVASIKAVASASVGAVAVEKVEISSPMPVDKAEVEAAVRKLNELAAPALQTIQFSLDEEADRVVVKVVDTETQKVLRQIPNEEVLAFSKSLVKLQGLVIRQTA